MSQKSCLLPAQTCHQIYFSFNLFGFSDTVEVCALNLASYVYIYIEFWILEKNEAPVNAICFWSFWIEQLSVTANIETVDGNRTPLLSRKFTLVKKVV